MPKDRGLIAEKSQATRDFVIKNIDKLKKGDVEAQMQYQNLIGDLSTSAEQSKNFREAWEQRGLAVAKDPSAYREGVLDQHFSRASTEDAGNWNIDDSIYKKNINYLDRVTGDLSNYAQKAAKDTPYGKTYTRPEAEELIASDLENPDMFDQATHDFNSAENKLGAKTPVEYYQKKYAPKLTINDTKAAPEWMSGAGSGDKGINVTNTVTNSGGEMHVMNKANNEEVTVQYDNEGNVIGGVQGTRLTPEEKSQNDKTLATNIAKEKAYASASKKAAAYRATLPANPTAKDIEMYQALLPSKNADEYKTDPLPFKEKNIQLDAKRAQEIAFDKFGVKPKDIVQGNAPGHVNVQTLTKDEPKVETKPKEGVKIRVKTKDGRTGTIDEKDFNPAKYTKI